MSGTRDRKNGEFDRGNRSNIQKRQITGSNRNREENKRSPREQREYEIRKKRYIEKMRRKRKKQRIQRMIAASIAIATIAIASINLSNRNQEDIVATSVNGSILSLEFLDTLMENIGEIRVSFLAVGDNLGHMTVNNYADSLVGVKGDSQYNYLPLYENVSDIISEVDLAFINQETIIGGDHIGISGYPMFNSPEAWARDVAALGFDIVNAASNHTVDKGFSAIENSAEIWARYDTVTYVGAYISQEDADTIRVVEREGIKFAVLAYTYGTNGLPKPNEFCVYLLDEDKIKSDVAKAKEISDVVIVSAHWGDEGALKPNETQQKYAQIFADAEVDLVVGHHSHTVQPIEWVTGSSGNETLIVYGLGNFISTMTSVDNQLEIMLTLDFVRQGTEVVIDNIIAIPMVNHYDTNGATQVYFLEDYTTSLVSRHRNLSGKMTDVLSYYEQQIKTAIPEEYIGTVDDARREVE